jgi:hypothetical protein
LGVRFNLVRFGIVMPGGERKMVERGTILFQLGNSSQDSSTCCSSRVRAEAGAFCLLRDVWLAAISAWESDNEMRDSPNDKEEICRAKI